MSDFVGINFVLAQLEQPQHLMLPALTFPSGDVHCHPHVSSHGSCSGIPCLGPNDKGMVWQERPWLTEEENPGTCLRHILLVREQVPFEQGNSEVQKYSLFASAKETTVVVALSRTNVGKREEKPHLSMGCFSCWV